MFLILKNLYGAPSSEICVEGAEVKVEGAVAQAFVTLHSPMPRPKAVRAVTLLPWWHCWTYLSELTHPGVSPLGKEPNRTQDCSIHSLGHSSWQVSSAQGQRGAPRALQSTHAGNTLLRTRVCDRHTSAQLLKSRKK